MARHLVPGPLETLNRPGPRPDSTQHYVEDSQPSNVDPEWLLLEQKLSRGFLWQATVIQLTKPLGIPIKAGQQNMNLVLCSE